MARIPYGYRIVDGKAVIDEVKAQEVREFFRFYLEFKNISQAAKKSGIKRDWPVAGKILSKKLYLGTEFYPQIIDEDMFRQVQQIRHENAIRNHRYKEPKPIKEIRLITSYQLEKVEKKYDDPYRQAVYAYSQIKEV